MRAFRVIVLLFTLAGISQAKEWRGITPLKSTRVDVERLFGRSAHDGYGVSYPIGDEVATFEYSSGGCSDKGRVYDVPPYTVLRIRVSSGHKPRFSDLKIDLKKFRKVDDSELPDVLYYINDEDGVTYEVQGGLVMTTEYWPAAKDRNLRRCVRRPRRA